MKKVIYIEIDEEITSIFDRVKHLRHKEINLIVPRKSILFQSIINLKILNSKFNQLKKKLIIITTDRVGKNLCSQLGIDTYNKIDIKPTNVPEDENFNISIQPIQARKNDIIKEAPRRFTQKKITIAELIKDFREQNQKLKNTKSDSGLPIDFANPNKKLLALVLLFSIGLFFVISYIALPGATIFIKPKFDNISHTVNIVLVDKVKNQSLLNSNKPHVIPSEIIETVTKQTKVFNTTSKIFKGTSSKGKITIINTSNEEWELKGETRFKSDEGIIFRIKSSVFVPKSTLDDQGNSVPGTLEVRVEADPFDAFGNMVGDRGNIAPSVFTIPGLSKYNQKIIWGESYNAMSGGVTDYQKIVQEEDVLAARKQIKDNLILIAKEDLWSHIEDLNNINHSELVLLDDRRYLKTELLDLRISDDLEGSERDKFEVFAKIRAVGVAYDSNQLFNLLKKELKTRAHPDMRVIDDSINKNTITYEVIDEDDDLGKIKITATIKGIEEFVIDTSSEAGLKFSNAVKEKVSGMNIEEAESYINNLSEVNKVQIKVWPMWLSKMPRISDNIEIKLLEE